MLLIDSRPESSLLMKQYPELRAYRDVTMWWKFYLNADLEAFPNYAPPENPKEIGIFSRLAAQLVWNWSDQEKGYEVSRV